MGGERKAYGTGGSCTCGAMSDHVGMTRVMHWHGQYKGEVERDLRIWAETWDVQVESMDYENERGLRKPDVLLTWDRPDAPKVIAEIKEIVVPFCSFRSDDGEISLSICREAETTSLKQEAKRVRNKINRAAKQLRPSSGRGFPTLLVVGYWTPVLDQFLDFEISWAMRGGEHCIRITADEVGYDLAGAETGGRKAWGDVIRSISGLARVMGPWHGVDHQTPRLRVFPHNEPNVPVPRGLPGIEYVNA